MKLRELMREVLEAEIIGDEDVEVQGIEFDLFQPLKGKAVILFSNSLGKYNCSIEDLEKNNASCIISESPIDTKLTNVVVKNIRRVFSQVSANFYNRPNEKMKFVFITGTNGKTSTTNIVSNILNNGGVRSGVIGTEGSYFEDVKWETKLTTPDPNTLFKVLNEMKELGCECVVMEASAHALHFDKLYSLYAEIGILTNCKRDHLDFFHTEENYQRAKEGMFHNTQIKFAVVNGDDMLGKKLIENHPVPILSYGKGRGTDDSESGYKISGSDLEISYSNLKYGETMTFDVHCKGEILKVETKLFGEFNVYNILASIATAKLFHIKNDVILKSLEAMEVIGGRFEKIPNDLGVNIIIDFAHTPDSMENVIETARKITDGKVITVFGCGGDRDKGKRSIMGGVATKNSDYVVITSDNPRCENPMEILWDIEKGIDRSNSNYTVISGRAIAIQHSLNYAKSGDTVLILGKGVENYIDVNNVKYEYSDYSVVYEYIEKKEH